MEIKIKRASASNVEDFLPLFDAYRVFHKRETKLYAAKEFLTKRLESEEATVFIAYDSQSNKALGFSLLYSAYSNLDMERYIVLNDLFISSEYRGLGVGQLLIRAVVDFTREQGVTKIQLFATKDNVGASRLYQRLGFIKDEDYNMFMLAIS